FAIVRVLLAGAVTLRGTPQKLARLYAPVRRADCDPCPAPTRNRRGAASARRGTLLEHGNGREPLALEKLEERPAPGRDVRDAVADAELLDGGEGVASADDRERLARRDGFADPARARGELGMLEHTD